MKSIGYSPKTDRVDLLNAGPLSSIPLFFPGSNGPLFGVIHTPSETSNTAHAVTIVPPMGQDYLRSHKTLQKLATDLAKAGFHVLRFDFTGTGDSADAASWDLATWATDCELAMCMLKELTGVESQSLVGMRMGGSVAMMVETKVEHLVLWDPIADGKAYLDELEQLHTELCSSPFYFSKPRHGVSACDELLGYYMPTQLKDSLRQFSLVRACRIQAQQALWLDVNPSCYSATQQQLQAALTATDKPIVHKTIDLKCDWASIVELRNVLMGQPAANAITKYFLASAKSSVNGD